MKSVLISSIAVGAIAVIAAVGTGACSTESSATQCAVDGDCAALGFTGYACQADGTCKPGQRVVSNEAGALTDECTTSDECSAKNGQRPAICRKEPNLPTKCVPLQTDSCPKVFGPWQDPKAIIFASFHPSGPELLADYKAFYDMESQQIDVAVNDINSAGGLPGTAGRRPLVHVECDGNDKGYQHASEVIKVPAAIITWETDLKWLPYAKASNTATLCSLCLGNIRKEAVAGGVEGSLSYGLLQASDYLMPAYEWKLKELEARVRADRGLTAAEPIKVMILGATFAGSQYITNGVSTGLNFNGKTVAQNTADGNLNVTTYNCPVAGGPAPDLSALAKKVIDFAPDILIPTTPFEWQFTLEEIEANWTKTYRPWYVAPFMAWSDRIENVLGTNDALRKRIVGLKMLPSVHELNYNNTPQVLQYNARSAALFPGQPPLGLLYDYDTVYLMAYAIAAAGQRPFDAISGADIATAIPKVTTLGATKFEAVPSSIAGALVSIANGPIQLTGLYTPLTFDHSDGSIPTDTAAWCISKAADGSFFSKITSQVYHYDTKTVTGTFNCDEP